MKNILSQGVLLLLLCSTAVFAQNKSLGVGTASPNANAALHVESPTSNQGIIIPRLSTVQRSSFSAALSGTDVGLIVFDTDLRALAIWNGSAWDIGSKVGQPMTATSSSASGNAGTFTITNVTNNDVAINGTTTGTGHAAYLEVTNPSNSNAALFVGTNGTGNAITANGTIQASGFIGDGSGLTNLPSFGLPYTQAQADGGTLFSVENTSTGAAASFSNSGTGVAGDFYIPNAASNNHAVLANTLGTGSAGYFRTDNATSVSPAINATTTSATGMAAYFGNENISATTPVIQIDQAGTGNAITAIGAIQATNFVGDGSGLTNLPASGWGLGGNTSTTPGTDFIGTSDAQDVVFKANNAEAVRILSSGQVGIGSTPVSAKLDVSSANTTIGIHAATSAPSGVQNRGLQADASGSTAQNIGVYGTGFIDGSSGAIGVYGEGIGNGISDAYGLYGMTNNFTATTGKTFGVYASAENGSVNWAGYFDKGNVHIKNALSVGLTDGTFGTIGQVLTSQGGGTAPTWSPLLPYTINMASGGTLLDVTNSSGGMAASFASANGSQSLYVLNTGTGRAGMFSGSPAAEGVLTSQSGGAGASLSLFHLANGLAIDIQSGGLRLSNAAVVAPATITTRVALYRVTGSGNINLPGAQVGETCWVSNETAAAITINGGPTFVAANAIRQFIFIGSGWTIVN